MPCRPVVEGSGVRVTLVEALASLGGGLPAGAVNAIAGRGSLITFSPLVVIGLPGRAANVSNALSVAPPGTPRAQPAAVPSWPPSRSIKSRQPIKSRLDLMSDVTG